MNYKKFIIFSTVLLFVIGTFMHFIYQFSGSNVIIGLIAPVNESVWEHTKMILVPTILLWLLYYIINKDRYTIDKNKWFLGCLISLIAGIFSMISFYYFYTGAFGFELLVVDILILLFSLLIGQLLGIHFYKNSKGISICISIPLIISILLIYVLITFNTPRLPIFKDIKTNTYGINMLK